MPIIEESNQEPELEKSVQTDTLISEDKACQTTAIALPRTTIAYKKNIRILKQKLRRKQKKN